MTLSKSFTYSLVTMMAIGAARGAAADPLSLAYFTRPGFAELVDGKPSGAFLPVASAAVAATGLNVEWLTLPQKRLLDQVSQDTPNYCAVGIYKNADRLKFGKFSDPFYRDQRFIVVSTKANEAEIKSHNGLMNLLENKDYKLGAIAGFSYGIQIDAGMKKMTANLDVGVVTPSQLFAKVAAGRIVYTLAAPEEIDSIMTSSRSKPDEFARVVFEDVPEGANRHFMCGKSVDDAIITRLNAGIASLHLAGLQ